VREHVPGQGGAVAGVGAEDAEGWAAGEGEQGAGRGRADGVDGDGGEVGPGGGCGVGGLLR